jgi:hypothetical protein
MISWSRHSARTIAAATALLLQVAVYFALTERRPAVPSATSTPTIIAMLMAAARPRRELPPPPQLTARPESRLIVMHPLASPLIPSLPKSVRSRSAFDWQGAIRGEVNKALTHATAAPRMRFDIPRIPLERLRPREWDGWDEVHGHRIQRLAQGIIDLGHGCFIKLPIPIPQCDSEPPNGDLFSHMRDRRYEAPGSLP